MFQAVIAASMTDKSPFVVPIGKLDAVNAAKQAISLAASDHLTIYKAYHGYSSNYFKMIAFFFMIINLSALGN